MTFKVVPLLTFFRAAGLDLASRPQLVSSRKQNNCNKSRMDDNRYITFNVVYSGKKDNYHIYSKKDALLNQFTFCNG